MTEYRLKPGKVGKKVIGVYEKAEKKFTDAFLEEDTDSENRYRLKTGKTGEVVISAYRKIEDGAVGAYKKVENAFTDAFLEICEDESENQCMEVHHEKK